MAAQSKTFCPLPFIHSFASVSGKFKPCCNTPTGSWDKTTRNMTYQEWFYSKEMVQLRDDLLNNVQNKMCTVCWNDEKVSGSSIRQRYIEKFKNITDAETPKIKYLDLKLSNECNLKCRMCSYVSSHLIGAEMKQIEENNLYMPKHWERSPNAELNMNSDSIQQVSERELHEILSLLPQIRVLKITGGEPTISKQFLDIIEVCNNNNYAENIQLSLTTNATKFTKTFLDKLRKFESVSLNISCDGFGNTYDYIRYPFNWNKFQERIQNLKDYRSSTKLGGDKKKFSFGLAVLPVSLNIENLPSLHKWSRKFIEKGSYTWPPFMNTEVRPEESFLHLKYVPTHILQYAYDNLDEREENKILMQRLKQLIDDPQPISEDNEIEIMKSIQSVDSIRSQDYRKLLEPMTVEWIEGIFKKYA